MPLPSTFQFSQDSLQTYVDCPRRFQLRFLLTQPWPGLITDSPMQQERHMQRGADFHRLVHQHMLGLSASHIADTIGDPVLMRWWLTYLAHPPPNLPLERRHAEVSLSAPLGGHRLTARIDLLAIEPSVRALVVDWKTPLRQPSRQSLAKRMQTRVYRYLVVESGAGFNDWTRFDPSQVSMVYWFASSDGSVECFPYDAHQHFADATYLTRLASEIDAHQELVWPLTPNEDFCQRCSYRSLCERSVSPALLTDLDDDLEQSSSDFDVEHAAEIAF